MRNATLFAMIFAAACTGTDPGNGNSTNGGNAGCQTNETCETTGPNFSATIDVILPADPATVSVVLDQNANGEIDDGEPSFPVDNCTTASCSHTVNAPGTYLVDAECVELLYRPVTVGVENNGDTILASWINYGDYGPAVTNLECSGTYDDGTDAGDVTVNVENVEDRGIAARGLPFDAIPMLGYLFEGEVPGTDYTVSGQVAGDLSSIYLEEWEAGAESMKFSITYDCGR